ncbi:MAG TPA: pantoate--beta-alanine ligase [Gammaproteobacteria bacterium]|nr:pantoate--beta-alanine ligase [Gammaproteobacteria bacterium]
MSSAPGRVFAPMPLAATAEEVRERVEAWREARQTVVLVPTLGNLHEGHLSLVRLARNIGDRVVVSIFVNPTQFGPTEDFAHYPRTLEEDRAKLAEAGTVDLLFVPDEKEIYPFGTERAVRFVLPPLSRELCGATRPGHFDGVASVVCRLLNVVEPNTLVLGRKDYQQLVLVEHMVADLRLPVRVVSGATFREPDGLAMSSRNRYLTEAERGRAPRLHAVLEETQQRLRAGSRDYSALEREAMDRLREAGFRPDYVEVRRAAGLTKPETGDDASALIVLAAAWLGGARLLDNTSV